MSKHIPLKWINKERWITEPKLNWSKKYSEAELKYFNRPTMKAEQTNEWAWWVMLGALIVMEAMVILKVLGKI